jgi:urea transport system permease protein
MTKMETATPFDVATSSRTEGLPQRRTASSWTWRVFVTLFLLALFLPAYLFASDRYWMPLFTRYMALALFALSVDMIWGYTGLLSLGQGLYFGLGVYAVGYCLKLRQAAMAAGKPFVAAPDMELPNFMAFSRLEQVPGWIAPLIDIRIALAVAVVVPTLVAFLFGAVVFWRGIKGVYFALITQGLLLAVFTFVDTQIAYCGGRVGMTYLTYLELFGHTFKMESLYYLVTGILVVAFILCAWLMNSKLGRILTAIRDNENRVLALGYNTAMYKTFIFTLAGTLAGIAGALYVSVLGTAGPDRFGIVFSIEVVIMVAVGGRGTLVGAVLGAVLVSLAETYIGDIWRELWQITEGLLFIFVVLLMPEGIIGVIPKLINRSPIGYLLRLGKT